MAGQQIAGDRDGHPARPHLEHGVVHAVEEELAEQHPGHAADHEPGGPPAVDEGRSFATANRRATPETVRLTTTTSANGMPASSSSGAHTRA